MIELFCSAPRGCEPLLVEELSALGATAEPRRGGVRCAGSLDLGYRVCLWSRVCNRVLLQLAVLPASDADQLYQAVGGIDWDAHVDARETLAIDVSGSASWLAHPHFAAQRVKDAIVDQLRARHGARPTVDNRDPAVRLHLHLAEGQAQLSVDLTAESLHRRDYRASGGRAPLKENLAAAMLLAADWPAIRAGGASFVDPMCGSGTLPVEAALIALDVAPGVLRGALGSRGWRGQRHDLWRELLAGARARDRRRHVRAGEAPPIVGCDADPGAVRRARESVERAGLAELVRVEQRSIEECRPPADGPGLLLVNPPYGRRLGQQAALKRLYLRLGDTLKQRFDGWTAHVLAGDGELAQALGLRADRRLQLYNGSIPCRLLRYPIRGRQASAGQPARGPFARLRRLVRSGDAEDFANRLAKNQRQLRRWAEGRQISCYRVYDADIPQYAAAVDRYGDALQVAEYAPPRTVSAAEAADRFHDVVLLAGEVLDVAPDRVFVKVRSRQRGADQYRRAGRSGREQVVCEGGHRFAVNLEDYLDTGLFIDHREVRRLVGELARGRRFLNLFCYTATATVYAARGGATSSSSVDLSPHYLDWARRNLRLNGVDAGRHHLVRADCLRWLERCRERFGLIFVAPPTFSNSKRMRRAFDVQRDHPALLQAAARLLAPGGELLFASGRRRFCLDRGALPGLRIEDLSRELRPRDFQRTRGGFAAFRVRR